MMRCAQAAQVLRRIRAALRQRHPMVYQRCLNISSLCHAHFAERIPRQLRRTNLVPCSGMVSFLVRWVTKERVVIPVCFLSMFRAELSICQVRAAGILAGLQGFSGHIPHLRYFHTPMSLSYFRPIEKPSQVLSCKGFVIWCFLGSFPLLLSPV